MHVSIPALDQIRDGRYNIIIEEDELSAAMLLDDEAMDAFAINKLFPSTEAAA